MKLSREDNQAANTESALCFSKVYLILSILPCDLFFLFFNTDVVHYKLILTFPVQAPQCGCLKQNVGHFLTTHTVEIYFWHLFWIKGFKLRLFFISTWFSSLWYYTCRLLQTGGLLTTIYCRAY